MLSRKQKRRSNAAEMTRKADTGREAAAVHEDAVHKADAAREAGARHETAAAREADSAHKPAAVHEAHAAPDADTANRADAAPHADAVHEAAAARKPASAHNAAAAHKADTAHRPDSRLDAQAASQRDEAALATSASLLTVTGEQATIDGKFKVSDSLRIECEVGGELEIGGTMVVGEKGVVKADVQTVDALIIGVYEGNLVATGQVEIAPTGRVIGNLRTDSLVIERGGFFNGTVDSLDSEAQARAAHRPAQTRKPVVAAVDVSGDPTAHGNGLADEPKRQADLPRSPAGDDEQQADKQGAVEDASFLAEAQAAGGR